MEALATLSLVCNILQLVDAAGKAYNVCHEIHTLGASIEDQRMSYTCEQLQEAYTALNASLKPITSTGSPVLPSQVDLSGLGSRCCETARALHEELLTLRKKPDGGLRESVKVFVKKKRKAKSIEQIKTRLDEYQKVLDTKLLIDLRHVFLFDCSVYEADTNAQSQDIMLGSKQNQGKNCYCSSKNYLDISHPSPQRARNI